MDEDDAKLFGTTDETPLIAGMPVEVNRKNPWGRGIPQAYFNLVNTTIGAGVLSLPKVCALSGLGLGLILISLFGMLANYTLRLLHQVSLASQQLTYEDAALVIWDKWLALAVKIAVGVINFGGLISYMMICGDFLHPVMSSALGPDSLFADKTFLIGACTVLFILPLSLIRSIANLQYGSMLSIVFSASFVVIVIVRCFDPRFNDGDLLAFTWSMDVFQSIGMVLFAFSCHTNLIPVAIEMYDHNTRSNLSLALYASTCTCFLCYAATATFGYLSFYQDVDGNILNNYQYDDVLVTVMRVVLTFSIILTFPLALFPCRLSLDRLIFPHLPPFGAASSSGTRVKAAGPDSYQLLVSEEEALRDQIVHIGYVPVLKSTIRFVVETLCIILLSFLLAIFLPGIDVVFALVGSSGSACTGYIFPAILWFRARDSMPDRHSLSHKTNVILTPIVAFLGVFFGVLGTVMTIVGIVDD